MPVGSFGKSKKNYYTKVPLGGTFLMGKNGLKTQEMQDGHKNNSECGAINFESSSILHVYIFLMQKIVPLRGVAIQKQL